MAATSKDDVLHQYGVRVQRLRNWLWLLFAALLATAVYAATPPDRWGILLAVVVAHAVLTVVALIWWYCRPPRRYFVLASSIWGVLDVVATLLLQQLTDGAYLLLLFLFFLPMFSAFNVRPTTTVITVGANAAAFIIATLSDPVLVTQMTGLDIGVVIAAHLFLCALVITLTVMQRSLAFRIGELVDNRSALLTDVMQAEERERRTLADRLHDETLQTVLAARHDLVEYTESGNGSSLNRLEQALASVARSLRQATSELHPSVLETAGLEPAIRSLVRAAEERGRLRGACDISYGATRHDQLLYSTARELINNVVRHARASRLDVALAQHPGWVGLTVTDDGSGLDPQSLRSRLARGHIGVASHRVRVEAAGGTFEYLPVPKGTSAQVHLPLGPSDEPAPPTR
ncbi:hypothetical protein OHA27_37335 [Streptomyces sp. NBC_01619]|uniref:sensor histidine kinase n=1 Tax=Streptomyces sp. NBC_01619 TaxID=2975901 RepID=UPI00224D77DB|nr:ATP-binding protein [Streptomyces sp. NBC_01619]MCX4515811.1 hypothetical protein [Streptomyces sp. NBC_01619]